MGVVVNAKCGSGAILMLTFAGNAAMYNFVSNDDQYHRHHHHHHHHNHDDNQVKQSILNMEIYCPPEASVLLASYAVQVFK